MVQDDGHWREGKGATMVHTLSVSVLDVSLMSFYWPHMSLINWYGLQNQPFYLCLGDRRDTAIEPALFYGMWKVNRRMREHLKWNRPAIEGIKTKWVSWIRCNYIRNICMYSYFLFTSPLYNLQFLTNTPFHTHRPYLWTTNVCFS